MKRPEGVTKRSTAARNGSGSRHRRLNSSRLKHSRVADPVSQFAKRVLPLLGVGSLGLVAIITVYNVSLLGPRGDSAFRAGFSYNKDEGSFRGGRGKYRYIDGDPLRTPMLRGDNAAGIHPKPSGTMLPQKGEQQKRHQHEEGNQAQPRDYQPPPELSDPPNLPNPPPEVPNEPNARDLVPKPQPPVGVEERKEPAQKGKHGGRSRPLESHESHETEGRPKKGFFRSRPPKISLGERLMGGSTQRGEWFGGVGLDVGKDDLVNSSYGSQERYGRERAVVVNADDPRRQGMGWGQTASPQEGGETTSLELGREAALLVICANRPEYLEKALDAVAKYHPGSSKGEAFAMPVVLSQDGDNEEVKSVISRFKSSMAGIARVIHIWHTPPPSEHRAYFKLSAHYKWALGKAFDELHREGYDHARVDKVIILEEDLEIAPDFFEYFAATAPLLDLDESLMAVSAWNDNGQVPNVKDNQALVRTDFFPGLGWMLPRRVWDELEPAWPEAYWDDWLRAPPRRKERQFIRPEVCRTYHFGKKGGASNNQFGSHLDSIKLNKNPVVFREMDLSYLERDVFRNLFLERIRKSPTARIADVKGGGNALLPEVVIEYSGEREFEVLARQLGVMSDFKAGVPRTGYMGVVSVWEGETKVHLAPADLKGSL